MTMAAVARGAATDAARVGPNAILQYLPVLQEHIGSTGLDGFLEVEQLADVPDGSTMIEEAEAARFHRAVRRAFPGAAPMLARRAGTRTAEYIIAHRIPAPARAVLATLPRPLAEKMLCRSIAKHAWTFAGSGTFRAQGRSTITFEILGNPIVGGERADQPICHWHTAVFERLFSRLVGGDYEVTEKQCCACGAPACRFELTRAA
jgi:divinyl protochlorophyllide a 8-vinyl-reductase